MAGEAEDTIRPTSVGDDVEPRGRRALTVATDQEVGIGPVATQRRQQACQAHGMCGPRGAYARPEARRDARVGGPCNHEEWQIAGVLIVMLREHQLLRAMG